MVGRMEPRERASTPPTEPLRKLTEALLGAEVKKMSTRVTISFDAAADATDAHRVLVGLQDSYTPPR